MVMAIVMDGVQWVDVLHLESVHIIDVGWWILDDDGDGYRDYDGDDDDDSDDGDDDDGDGVQGVDVLHLESVRCRLQAVSQRQTCTLSLLQMTKKEKKEEKIATAVFEAKNR